MRYLSGLVIFASACSSVVTAPEPPQTSTRVIVNVQGYDGWVLVPSRPNAGHDWVWIMPTHSWANTSKTDTDLYEQAFLDAGFHVVTLGTGLTAGSPAGEAVYDGFYQLMRDRYGLNAKARLLGQSQGGLEAYGMAMRHPERVNRIGGIFPATDINSWPTVAGIPRDYSLPLGFTPEEIARLDDFSPIEHVAMFAGRFPVFHIHGLLDTKTNNGVDYQENTGRFMERFNAAGGQGSYLLIPNWGHSTVGTYRAEMAAFLRGQ